MTPHSCEAYAERRARNHGGDAFNPTANPIDEGLEDIEECTTAFARIKSYFSVFLKRCSTCGAIWLLGYYEDFDARSPLAEWGERNWIWRPLTPSQIEAIREASGSKSLDLKTFAA